VTNTCNLSIQEAEAEGSSEFLARCQWFTPVILAIHETVIRKTGVQSQPWAISSREPILKILNRNRAGEVAQAVEHLPSKCEALSSNSSMARKEFLKKKDFKKSSQT
jgi:hypothetical protein